MPVLDQVIEQYPRQVKIAFKQFPLRNHNFATTAAQGAVAAYHQGKFWEFHDLLFQNYSHLNDQTMEDIRSRLALDPEKFKSDMLAPGTMARINADIRDGAQAGVRGTPTVFVNGLLTSDKSLNGIQQAVVRAIKNGAARK